MSKHPIFDAQIEDDVCDLFGFCHCGNPGFLVKQLRDYLRYYSQEDRDKIEWCKDEWLWVAYLCDKVGLTGHGGSIGCVWVTEAGKEWLKKLESYEGEE